MSDAGDPQDVDLSKIGELAAELMEALETGIRETLGEGEAPPEIKTVAIVAELEWPPAEDNRQCGSTAIRYRCTDPRVWIQRALFTEAADIADRNREPAGE